MFPPIKKSWYTITGFELFFYAGLGRLFMYSYKINFLYEIGDSLKSKLVNT
jgi:hypothetical protein